MKILFIGEDGSLSITEDLTQEQLELIDSGEADAIRCLAPNEFERVIVDSEDVAEDEDDEDSEYETVYSIAAWGKV